MLSRQCIKRNRNVIWMSHNKKAVHILNFGFVFTHWHDEKKRLSNLALPYSLVLSFCHFLEYLLLHESFWFHHVLRMTGRMFIKAVVRKAIAAGKATRPDGTDSKLVGTMNEIYPKKLYSNIWFLSSIPRTMNA